jgi:hypothetical protein
MATKLKGLKIKRVALVDEGANPDAHIRFAKRNEDHQAAQEPAPAEGQDDRSIGKRLIDAIAKAFGVDVSKADAQTFSEAQDAQKWEKVASEAMNTTYLFMDSIRSILYDDEADPASKKEKMQQSVTEFAAAFEAATDQWAQGKSAEIKADVAVILAVKRNILDHLQAETQPQQPDPTAAPADNPDPGAQTPTVTKGATDMQFDTTKMTPEELETFNDLSKRYGKQEETTAAPPAPAAPAAPETEPQEDVSKGIAPELKEELEALRKFKAAAEERAFVDVAKKYELLGKKPEELAPVLKGMKQLGEEQYNGFIAVLDSNLEALEKSKAFDEIGKRGSQGSDDTSGAWAKIEAAAKEIMKSKADTTWEKAIDEACTAHPELLQQYEKARA